MQGQGQGHTVLRPWQVLARRLVADRWPWMRLWAEDILLPDGRVVEDFSIVEMRDHAVVVAVTPDGRIVAERNYKHGPRRVCLGLPAGYIEPGEDPLLAAQRELREETGYAAASWEHLGSFTEDGNRDCGTAHLYLAREARRVAEPDAGDLEEIEIVLFALPDLLAAAHRGDLAVLSSAAALALAAVALGTPTNC